MIETPTEAVPLSSHHHHPPHSPQCAKLLGQISEYIDGELEAKICAEIELHLSECKDCQVLVDTTQKTIALYRRHHHTEPALSPETTARLWQALEDADCTDTSK